MKKLLLFACAFALVALSGCTTVAQQALVGYEAAAVDSIKATNDRHIGLWTVAACATPYSAAIRNPQIIPALRALCLPNGSDAAPASMFEPLVTPAASAVLLTPTRP